MYTEAEQRALLQNFIELPRDHWDYLHSGDHVRYVLDDGAFRYGGLVKYYKVKADTDPAILLQSEFDDKKTWSVPWKRIRQLFIKPDVAQIMLQSRLAAAIKTLNQNLVKINDGHKALHARVDTLEAAVKYLAQQRR